MAKNACDGGGYKRFVFVKRKDGHLVADVRHYAALRENWERDHKEIIKYMNSKQSRQVGGDGAKAKIEDWSP